MCVLGLIDKFFGDLGAVVVMIVW